MCVCVGFRLDVSVGLMGKMRLMSSASPDYSDAAGFSSAPSNEQLVIKSTSR